MNRSLRPLLDRSEPLLLPFAYDAFSALLIEEAGFDACGISGSALAASYLGVPDIGVLSQPDTVSAARRVVAATRIPVLVDADTGFGGIVSAVRTQAELQAAGASGMIIEDQQMPKRCGHLAGVQLVETDEMVAKVRAVVERRTDPEFVIVARTDALGALGLDEAVARANAYLQAGADVAFVAAPETVEQVAALPARVDGPLLIVLTEGGRTPFLPADALAAAGYRLIGYSGTAIAAAGAAMLRALRTLRKAGTTAELEGELMPMAERNRILRLASYEALESGEPG